MTERGLPSVDGAPACPFVAFGDDREGRATSPDHRHRCFAETPPAPRALAHQEAYCLSSAFPVCPTFQDWAKREAAHARGAGERPAPAPSAVVRSDEPADDVAEDPPEPEAVAVPEPPREPDEVPVRRNPPRDWAAPPPWAGPPGGSPGSSASSGRAPADGSIAPEFLAARSTEGAGLAGSAADRLAGGPVPPPSSSAGGSAAVVGAAGASAAHAASVPPDDDLADLVQGRSSSSGASVSSSRGNPPPARTGRRPTVSSTRPSGDAIPGPSWERMRRYEAFPTIKTRASLPAIPRLAVLAGAIAVAALALFFLPALFGVGGGGPGGSASPGASGSGAVASASADPTLPPAPTQQTYIIKANDTLLKVSKRFGLTLDQLLAANPQIKNPNKIAVGDTIVIPAPSDSSGAPAATPKPSKASKAP